MASTESWGFRSLAELLRDLGPREGERKVYKKFKELYERAVRYSAGEPPDKWRPPGNSNRQQWLMELAAESLEKTLELRQNRPIQLPSDRQEETHKKLLNLAQRMGHMMHLQEEQVQMDTAYEVMQNAAYGGLGGIIHGITRWKDAVSAPDCSYGYKGREERTPNRIVTTGSPSISSKHTTPGHRAQRRWP